MQGLSNDMIVENVKMSPKLVRVEWGGDVLKGIDISQISRQYTRSRGISRSLVH